ncbi:MAG: transcriptional regulator [Treponema sp.]|nr:transcriptional regulator [Treponema sp.]
MYKLIISIVTGGSGELVTGAANSAGAGGGTILMGKGTAANSIIQLLGLGDSSKDITYNIVDEKIEASVREAIIKVSEKKAHFGLMFSVNVGDFIKAGSEKESVSGGKVMENQADYQMINFIVNKGYAEDAMAAARKAGAGGGTIIGARGTAKEGDAKFFGMEIVPEKEMLMILVPSEKKDAIMEAVMKLECFSKAGSGIVFSSQAENFTLLGKK